MASPQVATSPITPTATEEPQSATQTIGKRKRTPETEHNETQQVNTASIRTDPKSEELFRDLLLDILIVLGE